MWKIMILLIICVLGAYATKKGYVHEWIAGLRGDVGIALEQARPAARDAGRYEMQVGPGGMPRVVSASPESEVSPAPTPTSPVHIPQPFAKAPSSMDNCARARQNVQEMQTWMRSGGTVVDVRAHKKLSENDTFTALSQHRQYIETNCR